MGPSQLPLDAAGGGHLLRREDPPAQGAATLHKIYRLPAGKVYVFRGRIYGIFREAVHCQAGLAACAGEPPKRGRENIEVWGTWRDFGLRLRDFPEHRP